jgi:hypothetical protein
MPQTKKNTLCHTISIVMRTLFLWTISYIFILIVQRLKSLQPYQAHQQDPISKFTYVAILACWQYCHVEMRYEWLKFPYTRIHNSNTSDEKKNAYIEAETKKQAEFARKGPYIELKQKNTQHKGNKHGHLGTKLLKPLKYRAKQRSLWRTYGTPALHPEEIQSSQGQETKNLPARMKFTMNI